MNGRPGVLPPSPPASITRSSTGNALRQMSMSSTASGGRKYSTQVLEEQLQEHHAVLKEYLAGELRDDKSYQPHHRARDKLLRLSAIQFQELSTDVYDELLRREDERQVGGQPNQNVPRFLLPKTNFHPKRNQARQKLSTLPVKKFRELATDVLYELERRYPRFGGSDLERVNSPAESRGSPSSRPTTGNGMAPLSIRRPSNASQGPYSPGIFDNTPNQNTAEFGKLLPRTFQSNTMIPNKSTMVEDDGSQIGDDEDDSYDGTRSSRRTTNKSLPYSLPGEKPTSEYQLEISRLEDKVDELEAKLRDKDDDLTHARNSEQRTRESFEMEKQRSSNLKADLERQVQSAQNLSNSLQMEVDKLRASNASLQNDISVHSKSIVSDDQNEWKNRYEVLERDLHEQQQITDEVRQEAINSLHEMRILSERSLEATESEDKLLKQVHQLEADVNEWKSRYARTKTQLRSLRASSIGLHIQQQGVGQYTKDSGFTDEDGLVKDVHVTKFQIAIDELLHLSRNAEPGSVLTHMRTIVGCVKNITQDIDQTQPSNDDELAKQRLKLKSKVSAAANGLITAAKNFSSSNGISPVSLIDAAASHLTNAVVDLIRTVKIRPTPAGELEDDDDGVMPPDSTGYLPFRQQDLAQSSRSSNTTDLSSPRRPANGWPTSNHGRNASSRSINGIAAHLRSKSIAQKAKTVATATQDSELHDFLEEQTAALVHATQPFIQIIRSPTGTTAEIESITSHVGQITAIIGAVVQKVNSTLQEDYSSDFVAALEKHAAPITRTLEQCRAGLTSAQMRTSEISDEAKRREIVKERMPPLAFKIVKCTKTLLGKIDDIEKGNLVAADPVAPVDA